MRVSTARATWRLLLASLSLSGCTAPYELRPVEPDPYAPICIKDIRLSIQQDRMKAADDPERPPPGPCESRDCARIIRQALGGHIACPSGSIADHHALTLEIGAASRFNSIRLIGVNLFAYATLGFIPVYNLIEYRHHITASTAPGSAISWRGQGSETFWNGCGLVPLLGCALAHRSAATLESLQDTAVLQAIVNSIAGHREELMALYAASYHNSSPSAPSGGFNPRLRPIELPRWEQAHTLLAERLVASYRGDRSRRLRLAVIDFTMPNGADSELGSAVAEALTSDLFGDEALMLVEPRLLERIVVAQGLDRSSLFDPETAAGLGLLAGVEAIVTGTIPAIGDEVVVTARIIRLDAATVLASAAVSTDRAFAEALGR